MKIYHRILWVHLLVPLIEWLFFHKLPTRQLGKNHCQTKRPQKLHQVQTFWSCGNKESSQTEINALTDCSFKEVWYRLPIITIFLALLCIVIVWYQFGWGISKMVSPKQQCFGPRINLIKKICCILWIMNYGCPKCTFKVDFLCQKSKEFFKFFIH